MKYFLILYIIATFVLGSWQSLRLNYKLQLKHNLNLTSKEFISFEGNSFKKVFLKFDSNQIKSEILKFYVDNNSYKLVAVFGWKNQNILVDLGVCDNCNVQEAIKQLSAMKETFIEGVIVPLNRYNTIKKLLFKNDYLKNLWFYYDLEVINDSFHLSPSLEPYIIYSTSFISEEIKPNDVALFNPHLWYLIFWYSLCVFGVVSFYIRVKRAKSL